MRVGTFLGVVLVLAMLALTGVRDAGADQSVSDSEPSRVHELFRRMRAGEYDAHEFPELDRHDVQALLERAQSKVLLTHFPRNPLSSHYESTCREGLVALWLIEGIRQGNRYPSLNVLCLSTQASGENWRLESEHNHARALEAYQAWWRQVKEQPLDEEFRYANPLEGTTLRWY